MKLFKDKSEILNLIKSADNLSETKELTGYFQKLKKERNDFYLTLDELKRILKWKLRSQLGRHITKREANTEENVIIITKAAFAIIHNDKDFETGLKLKLLSTLTGVGIPVASAILTLCYPKQFSVIDFRNWRQVYSTNTPKITYSVQDYTDYLKKIKLLAKEYSVTPQEIDIAIWQRDIDSHKK